MFLFRDEESVINHRGEREFVGMEIHTISRLLCLTRHNEVNHQTIVAQSLPSIQTHQHKHSHIPGRILSPAS